jgi:NAD(P)H-nitrite reductase
MKLVVIGNGMVGHKLRKELMSASPTHGQHFSLRIGDCREVPEYSVQQGDDAQVLVR